MNKKTKTRFKNRFVDSKFQGESKVCRRAITIKDKDKNHRSYLQPKVQEILGLSLDLTIYNLECWIMEI
jgi:hypothetical protein